MAAHPDAVEAARLTGHVRYLELCDPEHPDYRPEYLPHVKAIAERGPQPPPVPREVPTPTPPTVLRISYARRAHLGGCLYRENCGCAAPKCWWKGVPVTLVQCQICMPR